MTWTLLAGLAFLPGPDLTGTAKMPATGLPPSKIISGLCLVRYRVSTESPECQAYFDQGLGYFYSYVWMEAARSFETALRYDPDCPMVWWGLSRALEQWRHGDHVKAVQKAYDLRARASHREQLLIEARMKEKGLLPNVGNIEARTKAAIETIDTLLSLYDEDEEGWYYRGQLAAGRFFGGGAASVPFYKALLRINPLHPGANHELVHYYENARRPALGWPYAEGYIASSPMIPHAFHMQAHLATRIGRWDKTTNRSARAIELERAYHREMGVKPKEDHQFDHHLETLMRSLIHDGRFREARAVKQEAWDAGARHWLQWFRLHLGERDDEEAGKVVAHFRKTDKLTAAYLAALLALRQNNTTAVAAEVETLRHALVDRKNDRTLELRFWETQGLLLCQTGSGEAGLKLLARAVEKTKNDYGHHAWGGGAYYMEAWGLGALQVGKLDIAEEAFLEALAHDPGSVRGAMGMQEVCERQGRGEEAQRFAELARRCWSRAEVGHFDAERNAIRGSFVVRQPADTPRTEVLSGGQGR